MSAQLIDGKAIALAIRAEIAGKAAALTAAGTQPGLAVILVGDDPASQIYVRNKGIACEKAGFRSETICLPGDTSQAALEAEIARLNADSRIHGILVQLPLPRHLNEAQALLAIRPEKDVDGFHPINAGRLLAGQPCALPCTPHGVMELLRRSEVPLEGKRAVVLGRSNIVGKPMALLLLSANCTVTICHSRTKNLPEITREADILVSAIGKANFVTADMVRPGAAVIDVGINRIPADDGKSRVVGDVDFDAVREVAGWLTPVPGGVGPMTIAMLLQNTLEAAERARAE